jgi:CDP-glycerol glycerophosphotransferase (TagB/SpsB family)
MKIDRRNPRHWMRLLRSAMHVAIALVLRPFRKRNIRPTVLLYGHKLGGNLLALHQALREEAGWNVRFLTLDPEYLLELRALGIEAVCASAWHVISWFVCADAIVTDHGLHALSPLVRFSDVRFADVWHGIPFKGFDADDFRVQHGYDEVWVASPLMARMYAERFGFDAARVHATGYARTDRLARNDEDVAAIRKRLGLQGSGACVLFAPTWKQDAQDRSLYPFDVPAEDFLAALSAVCERHDATLLVRSHINSGDTPPPAFPRVVHVPYARDPDTEGILLASDVLVCDWSSIAFDYLVLDRPTIFLDVPAPFAKGFSLGPEYRFGKIVGDFDTLIAALDAYLGDAMAYQRELGERPRQVREELYGGCADGNATARCVERLQRMVA